MTTITRTTTRLTMKKMNTNLVYKDMFGNDIKEGDYIVYGAVDGRSGTLRAGKVLKLTQTKPDKYYPDREPEPKVQVASWSNFRAEGSWRTQEGIEPSGRQKNVTLSFLDRMIVVPAEAMGEKIKRDLEGPIFNWDGTEVISKAKK